MRPQGGFKLYVRRQQFAHSTKSAAWLRKEVTAMGAPWGSRAVVGLSLVLTFAGASALSITAADPKQAYDVTVLAEHSGGGVPAYVDGRRVRVSYSSIGGAAGPNATGWYNYTIADEPYIAWCNRPEVNKSCVLCVRVRERRQLDTMKSPNERLAFLAKTDLSLTTASVPAIADELHRSAMTAQAWFCNRTEHIISWSCSFLKLSYQKELKYERHLARRARWAHLALDVTAEPLAMRTSRRPDIEEWWCTQHPHAARHMKEMTCLDWKLRTNLRQATTPKQRAKVYRSYTYSKATLKEKGTQWLLTQAFMMNAFCEEGGHDDLTTCRNWKRMPKPEALASP